MSETGLHPLTPTANFEVRTQQPKGRPAIWRARLFLVMEVVVLIWLGMMLIVLPWSTLWTSNALLGPHFTLRHLLMAGWVRGAVTGLGLVNIWIGIWDAVHYHEQ